MGFSYISLVAGKMIPVPTGSSLALDFFNFLITYGVCEKKKYCFFVSFTLFFLLSIIDTNEYQTQNSRRPKNFDILIFIVPAREFLPC